jgi:hypothetical protein
MNDQEIIQYFGGQQTVYSFVGSLDQLQTLNENNESSYNYVIVRDAIYFVCTKPISGDGVTVMFAG